MQTSIAYLRTVIMFRTLTVHTDQNVLPVLYWKTTVVSQAVLQQKTASSHGYSIDASSCRGQLGAVLLMPGSHCAILRCLYGRQKTKIAQFERAADNRLSLTRQRDS